MTDAQHAARLLAQRAHEVGRSSGQERHGLLRWLGCWRLTRSVTAELDMPWRDEASGERSGWRQRTAYSDGEFAFGVDYQVCRECGLGWVEQPYTVPEFERCGLASAGLAALRAEYPGLAWHTLGGHFAESRGFWAAVGAGVTGAYEQRRLCPHVSRAERREARPAGRSWPG
ncbi:hypothetical protein UK12_28680 [Saccharothrix sp. ST-888]|nr:hypothetical protein UK12_28680 [Saccharothrix sp. ST-888]